MKIPLFDIDYTLLKRQPTNFITDPFSYAIKKIYGLTAVSYKKIDYSGKIDPQIILELVKIAGLDPEIAKKQIHHALKHIGIYYQKNHHLMHYQVLPGALKLLKLLKKKNFPIGVLTGNVEVAGWIKLEKAGLKEFIDFAVFGDMGWQRSDLIHVAHTKAKENYGNHISLAHLVIIGDSLKDIECAKKTGIKVIAVATGPHAKGELAKAKPDLLVDTLEEAEKILNILGD